MVSIALLGRHYQDQINTNPKGLTGIEVAWQGENRHALLTSGKTASVLVADVDLMEPAVKENLQRLRDTLRPELTLVVYRYAKREFVESLQEEHVRVLQGPLSLASLRSQMLSLIVRDVFQKGDTADFQICSKCGNRVPKETIAQG